MRFKIALCQMLVSPIKEKNISHARSLIRGAAQKGAKLVVLPEMWCCPYSMKSLRDHAEDIDAQSAPSVSMLSEAASHHKITIIGGSIPEMSGDKLFNTCCVLGPDGEIIAKHRKLHLFDADLPGDLNFRESDTFAYGDGPTVVDTDVGRIGIGICHDNRFPELAILYRSRGAHLICYPGAFNMSTGELLWELMLKSRAVDNQVLYMRIVTIRYYMMSLEKFVVLVQLFVAACSPARDPDVNSDYMTWGHSSLVGPFGEIIATTGHEEDVVIGEIDYSIVQTVRENLPLESQKRGDIYQVIDTNRK
ncbi:omega-amidase,chloroplastic-like protein [Carex littledalei]|uniref:Omega-amidase,chloroplastic-like protein n=1 Tax=Carex littledalei TaxID=544730 RepID=A0A833QMX8_9POAL|nr:omega-amidase,chloroplastic-like protein [Carex littledalei]